VQKEAIRPIESAPTTIPPRPYPHNPMYLPLASPPDTKGQFSMANQLNPHIFGLLDFGKFIFRRRSMVAQWLAMLPHSTRVPGSIPGLGHCLCWVCTFFPVSRPVSSGCSGFLPRSKDVWDRLIGHAKLPFSVKGISRVNVWGYRNRAWVGLW